MCGIVGLFLKDKSLEPKLGQMLSEMLITMTDRGPDSAGIAIYGQEQKGRSKLTVQSEGGREDYAALQNDLAAALETDLSITPNDTHAVIDVAADKASELRTILSANIPISA